MGDKEVFLPTELKIPTKVREALEPVREFLLTLVMNNGLDTVERERLMTEYLREHPELSEVARQLQEP